MYDSTTRFNKIEYLGHFFFIKNWFNKFLLSKHPQKKNIIETTKAEGGATKCCFFKKYYFRQKCQPKRLTVTVFLLWLYASAVYAYASPWLIRSLGLTGPAQSATDTWQRHTCLSGYLSVYSSFIIKLIFSRFGNCIYIYIFFSMREWGGQRSKTDVVLLQAESLCKSVQVNF